VHGIGDFSRVFGVIDVSKNKPHTSYAPQNNHDVQIPNKIVTFTWNSLPAVQLICDKLTLAFNDLTGY